MSARDRSLPEIRRRTVIRDFFPLMKVDSVAGILKTEYRFTVLIKYGAHNLSSKEWTSMLDPKGEDRQM